jgi:two-component system, OmpR family, KDP operon response regulator KdpE
MGVKVLIADDDRNLLRVLSRSLEQESYVVLCASNGNEALSLAFDNSPDMVLLDLIMPVRDGWETLDRLREVSDMPIIILSAHDQEANVVEALKRGADDYVTKPFRTAELKARIEAALRRAQRRNPSALLYDDGVLSIDISYRRVRKRGQDVLLSPKEFQLLSCLLRNAGAVVGHTELLKETWGEGYEKELGYLAIYIHYLRQKIEDDPSSPHYIQTRFRVGYCFCGRDGADAAFISKD